MDAGKLASVGLFGLALTFFIWTMSCPTPKDIELDCINTCTSVYVSAVSEAQAAYHRALEECAGDPSCISYQDAAMYQLLTVLDRQREACILACPSSD